MAIFCSFAINVSMNEMSSSSTEFNIVPGDSMFAATLKKILYRGTESYKYVTVPLGDWLERKKSSSYNHKGTIWVSH